MYTGSVLMNKYFSFRYFLAIGISDSYYVYTGCGAFQIDVKQCVRAGNRHYRGIHLCSMHIVDSDGALCSRASRIVIRYGELTIIRAWENKQALA